MWCGCCRYLWFKSCYVFSVYISRPSFSKYTGLSSTLSIMGRDFCSWSWRGTEQCCRHHQSSWWSPYDYCRRHSCGREPGPGTSWASFGLDASHFSSIRTSTSSCLILTRNMGFRFLVWLKVLSGHVDSKLVDYQLNRSLCLMSSLREVRTITD